MAFPQGVAISLASADGDFHLYDCHGSLATGVVTCPTGAPELRRTDLDGVLTVSVLGVGGPTNNGL